MKFKILFLAYKTLFPVMACLLREMEKCKGKEDLFKNLVIPYTEGWLRWVKDEEAKNGPTAISGSS